AAVQGNWAMLVSIMLGLTNHVRPGPRRWATFELGLLGDVAALETLRSLASGDPEPEVRSEATWALERLDPQARPPTPAQRRARPFVDPSWQGDASGREGAEATRRIIRALMSGALHSPILDDHLRRTGDAMVMTPGSGVYPPREPEAPSDGSPPEWRATIQV